MIFTLIICIVLNITLTTVFVPLFKMRNNLSYNIQEKSYPKFIELNKTIITLASTIIAITVSFLNNSNNRTYLIISWILFGVCIVASVMLLFLQYSIDYSMGIMNQFHNNKEEISNDKKSKFNKDFKYAIKRHLNYKMQFFISFYIQLISFATGIVMLLAYGINQVS